MSTSTQQRITDFELIDYRFEGMHFTRRLGKSQFSVWAATEVDTKREVAVKVFVWYEDDPRRQSLSKQLDEEVNALVRLGTHGSMIRFFYIRRTILYTHQTTKALYESVDNAAVDGIPEEDLDRAYFNFVAMELVDGGSLDATYTLFTQNNPAKACRQLAGVADALAHLHRRQVHRDIKPANLFYDKTDGSIKVGDLGLAMALEGLTSQSICGTLQYLAPECFSQNVQDTPKRDVYAFAVSLYQILTGNLPFEAHVPEEASQRDRVVAWEGAHKTYQRPTLYSDCVWDISFDLSELIRRAMSPTPDARPSMAEIGIALRAEAASLNGEPVLTNHFSHAVQRYSPGTKVCEAPVEIFHPYIRTKFLNQEAYWLEIYANQQEPDRIDALHQALIRHVGPYYRFTETFSKWSFLVCVWCPNTQNLAKLWSDLAGIIDEGRVMRCSGCSIADAKVNEVSLSPKLKSHEILHDLNRFQKKADGWQEAAKRLRKVGAMQSSLVVKGSAICYCYVNCLPELLKSLQMEQVKDLLLGQIRKSECMGSINGAHLFERSQHPVRDLPEKIKEAESHFLVVFSTKHHDHFYRIATAVLNTSMGKIRPDTRISTGGYLIWNDDMPIPNAVRGNVTPQKPKTLPLGETPRHGAT
jgi:hypothetical protein